MITLLALIFPLFQNMSPWEDIRDWAPPKPQGYLEDPNAAYIPKDFHGKSLNDIGQSLLDYNFGDQIHHWEGQLNHWGPDTYSHDDIFGVSSNLSSENSGSSSNGKFRWGLPNPSMMRFSYLGTGSDTYKITCDVGPGVGGAKFAFSTRLDAHTNLEMTHQTSDRQSQIHMSWDW